MTLAGDLFLLLGAAFAGLGALGLIRMPDVYNRLQAGTKSVTLGTMAILIGIGLHHPDWWSKLLIIGLFFLAEAFVYGVLGSVGGYLIGQLLAISLQKLQLISEVNVNFSSVIVVYVIVFTIALVVLSTVYPAVVATRDFFQKAGRIEAREFATWRALLKRLDDAEAVRIRLRKTK